MIQHDPRCDQHHTPRQRCNRHMTPAAARIARLAVEEQAAESPAERESEAEPSAMSKAVATMEPLEPTVFVSREWNATTEGVEKANRPAVAVAFSRPASGLVAVALGFGLLLIEMRRRRGRT